MRHWLKLMSLFLIGFVLTAQGDVDLKVDVEKPKLKNEYPSVKVNIAGLSNTLNGGIGFAFDFPLSKRWFFEIELGPIMYGRYLKYKKEQHYGLRTRGSFKYITKISDADGSYSYIKGELKYNRVKSRRFFTTLSLDGNFSQDQLVDGTFETHGPSFHFGSLQLLGENERFFFDYSFGFGLVYWNYPLKLVEGFELELIEDVPFLFGQNTSGGFFDLVFSFKIGMFLGKELVAVK